MHPNVHILRLVWFELEFYYFVQWVPFLITKGFMVSIELKIGFAISIDWCICGVRKYSKLQ
jgi:hypothetical protein